MPVSRGSRPLATSASSGRGRATSCRRRRCTRPRHSSNVPRLSCRAHPASVIESGLGPRHSHSAPSSSESGGFRSRHLLRVQLGEAPPGTPPSIAVHLTGEGRRTRRARGGRPKSSGLLRESARSRVEIVDGGNGSPRVTEPAASAALSVRTCRSASAASRVAVRDQTGRGSGWLDTTSRSVAQRASHPKSAFAAIRPAGSYASATLIWHSAKWNLTYPSSSGRSLNPSNSGCTRRAQRAGEADDEPPGHGAEGTAATASNGRVVDLVEVKPYRCSSTAFTAVGVVMRWELLNRTL